jgi:hypothetical protein
VPDEGLSIVFYPENAFFVLNSPLHHPSLVRPRPVKYASCGIQGNADAFPTVSVNEIRVRSSRNPYEEELIFRFEKRNGRDTEAED